HRPSSSPSAAASGRLGQRVRRLTVSLRTSFHRGRRKVTRCSVDRDDYVTMHGTTREIHVSDPNAGYDVVILGGGSGGYATALRAAQLDLSVVLIEKDKLADRKNTLL